MPIVRIEVWAGRSPEIKKKLIEGVTKAVCDSVGCPPETVFVIIDDIPKENWGQSGKQASS